MNKLQKFKVLKNPISKKNKLKLYFFNLKNTKISNSFRNSIFRYSNLLTIDSQIKEKTLKDIKKKKKISYFCNSFNKSKSWFVLDLILDNQYLSTELDHFYTFSKSFLNYKPSVIIIDKIILDYLKNSLTKNSLTKDFFLKKETFSKNLKILPFSKNLDDLTKKYLSFINILPEHLKLIFFHNPLNLSFFDIENVFSTQKLIIFFEKNLTSFELQSYFFFLNNDWKTKNFHLFSNSYLLENFFFQKLNFHSPSVDNTLVSNFLNLNQLDLFKESSFEKKNFLNLKFDSLIIYKNKKSLYFLVLLNLLKIVNIKFLHLKMLLSK